MKLVNTAVPKKDALQLLTGQPVYTDDLAPKDCLIVKLLRSPYASALVKKVNKQAALLLPDIEAVYTWEDVPAGARRFTLAGQTYPEASPCDHLLLDRRLRYIGDPVAIVAGRTEAAVERALSLLKVEYEVLEPLLDFTTAKDNPILVHPEADWQALCPVGADNKRNLCAHAESGNGDIEATLASCDLVLDRTYHTKAVQQCMMETFRTFCTLDAYGRLVVTSATQVPFHVRRIVANALGLPKSKIRVLKPRIGGGFGAKQTCISEMYPAFVTWQTKKPSKLVFSRYEAMTASSPRHEMQIRIRLGAMRDGRIRGIDMYALSNTGAYGDHGPTTVDLAGHKPITLYRTESYRFVSDVVYTNYMSAGAYRGYGAPQGMFALESAVNELAAQLGLDAFALREMNITHEGDYLPSYYGETNTSCALDRCLARAKAISGWEEKGLCRDLGGGKLRALGMAMAMQGSSISNLDVGGATLKLGDEGSYNLLIGAADMGTGCDTILAQIAAEVLECDLDAVSVFGVDTDASPYDSGSYASSTTYLTGQAVYQAAQELRQRICALAARRLGCTAAELGFDGQRVAKLDGSASLSLAEVAAASQLANDLALEVTVSTKSTASPPPFMVGVAEIDIDTETGEVRPVNYYGVVDCGTCINPNLARVQTEGGIVQGLGMALSENVTYSPQGRVYENSLMQYKIPSRLDNGRLQVEFEPSYEKSGPFGAKSIGELVINTPGPAVAAAIANALGTRFYELPITPEQVALAALARTEK